MRVSVFRMLSLAVLVLLVLLGYVLMTELEAIDRIVDRGPGVEVQRNQYLAAGQLLKQQGQEVVHSRYPIAVEQLGPQDSLVLTSADYLQDDPSSVEQLLQWVESGGHLIWHYTPAQSSDPLARALGVQQVEDDHAQQDRAQRMPTTDAGVDLETEVTWLDTAEEPSSVNPSAQARADILRREADVPVDELSYLAAARGARIHGAGAPALRWQSDAESIVGVELEAQSLPTERTGVLLLRLGNGRITVLRDIGIWSNNRIGLFDHAYLLLWLNRDRAVVHIQRYSDWPSLSQLLLSYAPEVLVMALCLLLAWLLRCGRRFGPALQPSHQQRRTLNEHIEAVARFHYRHGHLNHLLAPLRRQILRRAARLQGGLEQLAAEQQQVVVAAQAQLPPEEVSRALTPREDYTSAELVETVQLLIRIRNRL